LAALRAWRLAAAADRQLQRQLAHARRLLRRRLLGRTLQGWRRAALAGKLGAALSLAGRLQEAAERMSSELDDRAHQVRVVVVL
jgi:hypothetical protein